MKSKYGGYRVQPGEHASGRQVRHDSAAMRLLPIEDEAFANRNVGWRSVARAEMSALAPLQ